MDQEFGTDIVILTDEEGCEHEFEHVDTIEYNSNMYLAFVPAGISEDSEEEIEIVILRLDKDESGEEILATVDDEEELQAVYDAFMEAAFEEDEEE